MKLKLICDKCDKQIMAVDIPLVADMLADVLAAAVLLCPQCKALVLDTRYLPDEEA